MTPPLQSISALSPTPRDAIVRHLDQSFRKLLGEGESRVPGPGFLRVITGKPHPFANLVLLKEGGQPEVAERAVKPLCDSGLPRSLWPTAPLSPAVLAALKQLGFAPGEVMPAMAVEIGRLPPTELPEGYTFVRLDAQGPSAEEWTRSFAEGFSFPMEIAEEFAPNPLNLREKDDSAETQYFAVLREGKVVATSAMCLHEGMAGIYCVSTLPGERGKGLGAHVTAESLRRAAKAGYRIGILHASQAGYPVYCRLGFQEFGTLTIHLGGLD